MIKQGKFGPTEAIIIFALTISAKVFISLPASLFASAKSAAWMTPIGGMVLALVGVWIMGEVLARSPGKNIVNITENAFGPYLGTMVNLIYVVFFLAVASLFCRQYSEEMIVVALPDTPISVISAGFLAIALLGAYLGIEGMARATRIIFSYIFASVFILLVTLYPQWNWHNLYPVMGGGPYAVFGQGTLATGAIAEIILAGVIVQAFAEPKQFKQIMARAVIYSSVFFIIFLVIAGMTHNWRISSEFNFPFYRLARSIYLGRFFQRVEPLYILVWGFIGIVKLALALYGASFTLAESLKLPDYRPLIWPIGLTSFIFSFFPMDLPTIELLDLNYLRPGSYIPNYLIPLVLLLVLWFKGRNKDAL